MQMSGNTYLLALRDKSFINAKLLSTSHLVGSIRKTKNLISILGMRTFRTMNKGEPSVIFYFDWFLVIIYRWQSFCKSQNKLRQKPTTELVPVFQIRNVLIRNLIHDVSIPKPDP
jgi:hypothetical protein